MKIKIINGPNLNLLGDREPTIYGTTDFRTYLRYLNEKYSLMKIEYSQSNFEGEIIDFLHKGRDKFDGFVLNAGAYSHYSIAIRDAIAGIKTPVVEVHISNIYNREEFRQKSVISAVCSGVITGFGLKSYELAINSFLQN